MFIDIHVHVTRTRGVLRKDGTTYCTPDELVGRLDHYGIDKAVVMCGVCPECRHRYVPPEDVIEACEQHPDRLIPFCMIDPRSENNSPSADFSRYFEYYKTAGCKGVGELIANLWFDDPMVWNLLRQCAAQKMPVTFHIGPKFGGCYGLVDDLGLPRLEKTLKEFPNLTLIGHSQPFWAEIGGDLTQETRGGYPKGAVAPGGRLVGLFERYENLYGDLSAGSGHNAVSRDPEFGYQFMDRFQDRLLFGTDISGPKVPAPMIGFLNEAVQGGHISREVYEKISWRNADRLLELGIA
ncbi:MAG: amidohydrolase family protein [Planctomycetota bacterium]